MTLDEANLAELERVPSFRGEVRIDEADRDTLIAAVREGWKAKTRVATLEARLEIDHAFKLDPNSDDFVRFEIPPADRETWPDGITARDATIELLEAQAEEAEAEVERLRTALTNARPLVEKWCHYQGTTKELFDQYLGPIDTALEAKPPTGALASTERTTP